MHPSVHWSTIYNSQDMEAAKCPATDKWIKKMCYTYIQWNITQPLKKNEIMPLAATWIDLENIILNEVSQTVKDKYYMIMLICSNKKNDTNELIYKTEIEEGTYVHLWLIHVDVWKKPTQHWKAIVLQLKINKLYILKTEIEYRKQTYGYIKHT